MKFFAVTVPGFALLGWLIYFLLPLILPFVLFALVAPIVSAGVLVAYLGCVSILRRWRGFERPQLVDPAFTQVAPRGPQLDYAYDFRHNLMRFTLIGNSVGFGVRRLVPHYMDRSAWDVYTDWHVEQGSLRDYGGRHGFDWARDWSWRRYADEMRAGRLPLPHPSSPPPAIVWVAREISTLRSARTQTRNAEAA